VNAVVHRRLKTVPPWRSGYKGSNSLLRLAVCRDFAFGAPSPLETAETITALLNQREPEPEAVSSQIDLQNL
jgi:hypothetical protein